MLSKVHRDRHSTRPSWRCPARASPRCSSAWTSSPSWGGSTGPRKLVAQVGRPRASSSSTRSTPSACAVPGAGGGNERDACPLKHRDVPMFLNPLGTRTASGDVIIESREWRDLTSARRWPTPTVQWCAAALSAPLPRAVVPGMFGGGEGSGALNQLLVVMDGVDNPPFLRRIGTRFVNTLMDASCIVPQRIWKIGLRMPRPKPRNDQVFLHRRDQRPPGRAGSGAHARRAHGPPGAVPHPPTRSTAPTCSTSTWPRSRTPPTWMLRKPRDELARRPPGTRRR